MSNNITLDSSPLNYLPPSSDDEDGLIPAGGTPLPSRDFSLSKTHSPLLKILLVVLVVVNVVGQSTYLRLEFSTLEFNSYFLLTWMGCLFLTLAYPISLSFFWLRDKITSWITPPPPPTSTSPPPQVPSSPPPSPGFLSLLRGPKSPPWTTIIGTIFFLAVTNLGGTLLWYFGASTLSEGAQTSVYHIVVVFVYVLSIIFLREEATKMKSLACLTCVIGVALVGISQSGFSGSAGGYVATLGAALVGATYEVSFRKFLLDSDVAARVPAVLSAMGMVVVSLLPLHYALIPAGIEESFGETFGRDDDSVGVWEVWSFLLGNAGFASSYYLIWGFGMPITSPLFFTICSLLQIPGGAVVDLLVWGTTPGTWGIVGMVLVCSGVVLLAWPGNYSFRVRSTSSFSSSASFVSFFSFEEGSEEENDSP